MLNLNENLLPRKTGVPAGKHEAMEILLGRSIVQGAKSISVVLIDLLVCGLEAMPL